MSKQTQIISENEKQLAELERIYRSVESQIGLIILNSFEAANSLSKESMADAETFLKLQKQKDEYNIAAQDIRDRALDQKKCATELSKLRQTVKTAEARRAELSQALGCALTEHYSDSFDGFFADSYEKIISLQEKAALNEEELSNIAVSPNAGGLLANIKTTLDRSAKKTNINSIKQKLRAAYSTAAASAFKTDALKELLENKELPEQVSIAYNNMRAQEDEICSLLERKDELERQIEDDACFIRNSQVSAGGGSAQAKIFELEKKIKKAVISERIILSRVGKQFLDSNLKKYSSKRKKTDDNAEQEKDAFDKDIAPLIEQAKILQKDIASCESAIEKAQREIEIESTVKKITLLRAQILADEKRMDKLGIEKTNAETKIKLLTEKLNSLRVDE